MDWIDDFWTDWVPSWDTYVWDIGFLNVLVDLLLVLTPLVILSYFIFQLKKKPLTSIQPQNLIPNEQNPVALEPTTTMEQVGPVTLPKPLGRKKAKHVEEKEKLRRYREWQAHQERERAYRRELLKEEQFKYDREKEKLRQKEVTSSGFI
ncbi:hypothetical protein HMI56_000434 [Coelomomyces lativittatus]|nr:hypothetical protein HMI56_000434 [Coelomomyces lativittatus]